MSCNSLCEESKLYVKFDLGPKVKVTIEIVSIRLHDGAYLSKVGILY